MLLLSKIVLVFVSGVKDFIDSGVVVSDLVFMVDRSSFDVNIGSLDDEELENESELIS